jgi:poly(A) polymerase
VKLSEAGWMKRPGLGELLRVLEADAGQSRFVGGCVRDTLLELQVNEVDIATRLTPEEVMERLNGGGFKAVPTGIAHGTVTAVVNGQPIEVTTLRRDVSTDGRRATIAYTDDWREDAARRDFTMNALSADPSNGNLFDYFGGLADLQARRVRFIGNALQRIAEDHLRILRFFRFHARFGSGAPDEEGLEACSVRANDLMALSRERIADELLKLLALPEPSATVALMVEKGILRPVLPELTADGVGGLVALIERETASAVPPDPLRRLAAQPVIAEAIGARLRLSRKAAARLVSAAGRGRSSFERPDALAYRLGLEGALDHLLLSGMGAEEVRAEVERLAGWQKPRLPLNGGALIAMGLTPGPVVAKTLQSVERDWIAQGFPQEEKVVQELARARVDQALRDSQ